jgi:hypothetical protein
MSETAPEPTPDETPEPTPDDETEEDEAESNPPTEHELPEEEPTPIGTDELEPTPSDAEGESFGTQGLSPEELEKRSQKLDKAWDTYARAVGRILEEDANDLVPLYISPSAPPGFLSPYDAGRVPDEVKKPLLDFLGVVQEADYPLDPMKVACDLCNGMGKTSTESHVPAYSVLVCRVCNGTGLKPEAGATVNGPAAPALVPVPAGLDAPEPPPDDVDNWNTPRLTPDGMPNPNYGKQPSYWDHAYPVGGVS